MRSRAPRRGRRSGGGERSGPADARGGAAGEGGGAAGVRGQRMPAGERRVEAMVPRHGPALLRVANQFSLCHDDALDAYQRALEIYLRRLETVEAATEGAWM